jgi:hypothetical protein
VAIENAVEGVRWSSPAGGGADDGPAKRPWRAERQRPFDATMEIVGLKVGGRWWPWWPLSRLARAQSRMIPSARNREVYLFVSGSATIALPTDRRTRTTGSISPFFWDINQLCRRAKSSTETKEHQLMVIDSWLDYAIL